MKSKMVAIFAALMVALMVASVSYALWSETITISGTVNTGEVDVEWTWGDPYDDDDCPPEKDVSGMTVNPVDTDNDGDIDKLEVTINNAYPCINYYLPIDINNTGSIPVIISDVTINSGNLPAGATLEILEDEVNDPDIGVGVQLEPGEEAYGVLHVHLSNEAHENAEYTFSISITVVQWNEYS